MGLGGVRGGEHPSRDMAPRPVPGERRDRHHERIEIGIGTRGVDVSGILTTSRGSGIDGSTITIVVYGGMTVEKIYLRVVEVRVKCHPYTTHVGMLAFMQSVFRMYQAQNFQDIIPAKTIPGI